MTAFRRKVPELTLQRELLPSLAGAISAVAAPWGAGLMALQVARGRVGRDEEHGVVGQGALELSEGGALTATIGYIKGGTPRKFEFKRESG